MAWHPGKVSGLEICVWESWQGDGMYGNQTGWCNKGGRQGEEDLVGALRSSNGGQGEEETGRRGESPFSREKVVPETK